MTYLSSSACCSLFHSPAATFTSSTEVSNSVLCIYLLLNSGIAWWIFLSIWHISLQVSIWQHRIQIQLRYRKERKKLNEKEENILRFLVPLLYPSPLRPSVVSCWCWEGEKKIYKQSIWWNPQRPHCSMATYVRVRPCAHLCWSKPICLDYSYTCVRDNVINELLFYMLEQL